MSQTRNPNRPRNEAASYRTRDEAIGETNGRRFQRTPERNMSTTMQSPQARTENRVHPAQREFDRDERNTAWYQFPDSMLPGVFGDGSADMQTLKNIVSDIRTIQHQANGKHRFHFIVETDRGHVISHSSERFDHVVTRVLFSPSISLEVQKEDSQMLSFFRELNGISWRTCPSPASKRVPDPVGRNCAMTSSRNRVNFNPETEVVHVPRREGLDSARVDENHISATAEDEEHIQDIDRDSNDCDTPLYSSLVISISRRPLPDSAVANWYASHRNDVDFPYWFPFVGKEYTTGPQVTAEALYVAKEAIENFDGLESKQIQWIYRELFEFLFREAKRKKRRGVPSVFKYACFTPPWLGSQIIKGEEGDYANQTSSYFSSVVIPDMRNQRSRMGATRLAFILGAFLENEPGMTRKALIHLLRTVPVHPTLQKGRTKPRMGYMLPLSSTALRSSTGQRGSHLREPSNEKQDSGTNRNTDKGTSAVGDAEQPSDAVEPQDIARHEVSDRWSRNIAVSRSEVGSTANRRPVARRLRDDPIVLDDDETNEDAEQRNKGRNVRRRIEFGAARNSDNREDRAPVLPRMSDLINTQTPGERAMRDRIRSGRRNPHLFCSSNESDVVESNEEAEGELSNTSEDENDREPNEDEEDRHVHAGVESVALGSQICGSRHPSNVRIICAFGQQCLNHSSAAMQVERFVLGKCRVCLRPAHDRCKGGEFGESLCPSCNDAQ